MTRNKVGSLKVRLSAAKSKNRVAPRWIIVKKHGLKRGRALAAGLLTLK